MSTITIECTCGERYHAHEGDAGRRLRCRRCGAMLEISRPAATRADGASGRTRERTEARRDPGRSREARRPAARAQPASSRTARGSGWRPLLTPRRGMARLVVWLAWGYLAAVCLVAVGMWAFGDLLWPGTVLLFMGRWVFLLPLIVLVPTALIYDRVMLAPLAVALLVVAGPVMGARTGWRRLLPQPAGTPIRVMTFNVELGERLAQVLPEMLARWNADVVGFQECGERLATSIRQLRGWHHHAGVHLCVVSRYPIREVSVMDRSLLDAVKQRDANLIGGAGYVVRLTVDGPAGPFRVTNLHLETPRKGLEGLMDGDLRRLRSNTEIRDVESGLARRWSEAGTGPSIVLGDFNTPVESRIFRRHWGELANAFSAAGTGLGSTKLNGWIRVRIDHVLVGPEWHVVRARVGEGFYSDHRPLVTDLVLRR